MNYPQGFVFCLLLSCLPFLHSYLSPPVIHFSPPECCELRRAIIVLRFVTYCSCSSDDCTHYSLCTPYHSWGQAAWYSLSPWSHYSPRLFVVLQYPRLLQYTEVENGNYYFLIVVLYSLFILTLSFLSQIRRMIAARKNPRVNAGNKRNSDPGITSVPAPHHSRKSASGAAHNDAKSRRTSRSANRKTTPSPHIPSRARYVLTFYYS